MKIMKTMYRHMQQKHAGSNTNSLQGNIQTSMHAYIRKPKDQTRNPKTLRHTLLTLREAALLA